MIMPTIQWFYLALGIRDAFHKVTQHHSLWAIFRTIRKFETTSRAVWFNIFGLIDDIIMLVNKINYIYFKVKSGVVCP